MLLFQINLTPSVTPPIPPPTPTPGSTSTGLQTSGTLSTTAFDTRTLFDRAYGAIGVTPQEITGEKIQIAQDMLSMVLPDLVNTANPLWCLEKVLITLVQGQRAYQLPIGTNDVNRAFYRTLNNVTPVTNANTATGYMLDFGATGSTFVTTWAIDWAVSAQAVTFQASDDSVTWINVGASGLSNSTGTGTIWYDMKISHAHRYWQAVVTNTGTSLPISAARVYNTPTDVNMYRLNKDQYWNLTNKFSEGRPLQFYVQRLITPVMEVWPQPDSMAQQNVMSVYRQRLIMDVGSMQNTIEVPTRWFWTILFALADALAYVTPEANPAKVAMVQQKYQQLLRSTWNEERDKSPVQFQTHIGVYTR